VKSSRWDDTRLSKLRAYVDVADARAAFDELVMRGIALADYRVEPGKRGNVPDFRYLDARRHERPFSFITNRADLLFYVRKSGQRRVLGGLTALSRLFPSVTENPRGDWTVRIENAADARKLSEFLFGDHAEPRPGTREIAKTLWGTAKYQQRARLALPLLVKLARAGKTNTYGEFARRLRMPNARNLNFVLGSVGGTIEALSREWGEEIPPIEALIINRQTGSPGRGVDHFLATLTEDIPADREERIRIAQRAVFSYSKWDTVLNAALHPSPGLVPNGTTAEGSQGGVGYWWVNHKQTYRQEIDGEYLWSPKKNKNGANNESYNNMTKVMPADIVFSFADAAIRAVGIVLGRAREAPKPPEFAAAGDQWGTDSGWQVSVRFQELKEPLRPKEHASKLAAVLPKKHSPLRDSGDGNQGIYLAAISEAMAKKLEELLTGQVERVVESIVETSGGALNDDAAEERIQRRTDIGPTVKKTLINARRGQGVFRERLERIESKCRVTGLLDRRHLRASHVKPWCECDDQEKLDGFNGLLLSPHVDHLFDRGHISFSNSGELLLSKDLNPLVLKGWGIVVPQNVGAFSPEQCRYLEHHRSHVFGRPDGGRRVPAPAPEESDASGEEAPVVVRPE